VAAAQGLTLHAGGAGSQDQQQRCAGQHTAQHGCWRLQAQRGSCRRWGARGSPLDNLGSLQWLPHSLLLAHWTTVLLSTGKQGPVPDSQLQAHARAAWAPPSGGFHAPALCHACLVLWLVSFHFYSKSRKYRRECNSAVSSAWGGSEGVTGGRPGARGSTHGGDAMGVYRSLRLGPAMEHDLSGAAVGPQLCAKPQPGG
jgi:hypothetical protein